jgi:hypothetical protein
MIKSQPWKYLYKKEEESTEFNRCFKWYIKSKKLQNISSEQERRSRSKCRFMQYRATKRNINAVRCDWNSSYASRLITIISENCYSSAEHNSLQIADNIML